MAYDAWFDSDENRVLTAICTRKLITNIGLGGLLWGLLNIGVGLVAMQESILNAGIAMLGALMLGTGLYALWRPSLGVLLAETIMTGLLLLWNIGIAVLNVRAGAPFDPQGMIFPLVIAVVFANYYRKLGHLRELIASIEPTKISATKALCKALLKKKLKNEPRIVQTTDRKCRIQLMEDRAFFIQRDLMRAFVGMREAVCEAIVKPDANKWTVVFNHPVAKLKYRFDRKNTDKLKQWVAMETAAD